MVTHACSKFFIPKFWNDEYKNLDYVNEQFNDKAKLKEWQDQGYRNVATGFMCDMSRKQPSWNSIIIKVFQELGWQDIGTSYYRMDAGTILPMHGDLYLKYVKIFNLAGREHTIRRAIVFLEDWKSGHYMECNGHAFTQWVAGSTIEWAYDTPHMAANIGVEPRYTLQITGHV
jgi:hypothetical protein